MDPVPDRVPAGELEGARMVPSLQFAMVLTVVGVIVLGVFPGLIAEIGDLTKSLASGF